MIRRTFGQVKAQLAAIAGQSGMPVSDPLLPDYVNNAIYELANEGDWPGVVDRWYFIFDQITAEVCLPSHLERLIDVTVDDVPLEIRSPWYEFVQYGPGIQREADTIRANRRAWVDVVMDRGEQCVQHQLPEIGGPWTLSVQSQVDEDPDAQINIQGLDENGLIIRSLSDGTSGDWLTGINLTIGTSGDSSSQPFSKVTAVTMPMRNGYLALSATNGSDTIQLSNYAYNETTPSYRKYFIPKLWRPDLAPRYRERVILARCRRRFIPVTEDNDQLMISNVIALGEMMIAQWYRTLPDQSEFPVHKASAIDILRKEAMAYMGKSRTPGLTFSRGFPVGTNGYALR